jgi:hypothetical protein
VVLLVFGKRGSGGDRGTRLFHCPDCGGDRGYRIRRPLPGRRPELTVRCVACGGRFSSAALDVPTALRLEELLWRGTRTAATYVLAGLLAGGERWTPEQAGQALAVLGGLLGPEYGPEVLCADLEAHREGSDLEVLNQLGDHLAALGAERLLRGLADLVLVLDRSSCPDWHRLRDVAAALGVPAGHLRAVVDEASIRARE